MKKTNNDNNNIEEKNSKELKENLELENIDLEEIKNQIEVGPQDKIVMNLVHLFITKYNYNPVILHGAKNEVWLENLSADYKIVRIVSEYIHNDDQYKIDNLKVQNVVKNIKKKTLSFSVDVISIYLNISDYVHFEEIKDSFNKITALNIKTEEELVKNEFLLKEFPKTKDLLYEGIDPIEKFVKFTEDINIKNKKDAKEVKNVFEEKPAIVTTILIAINVVVFILTYLLGKGSTNTATLVNFGALEPILTVKGGQLFRLITSGFLHIGFIHLIFNMYALRVIGPQIESFLGRTKFIIIYLYSLLAGSLFSLIFYPTTISAGASGAIFGLLGSLLYFGYHYRVYLGTVIKSQIIPLIVVNLLLGFMFTGVNNAAHIGGLIGGVLITAAVGVKYKSKKSEIINGIILTIIFTAFLSYLIFFT